MRWFTPKKSILRNIHLSLLGYTAITVVVMWLFQIVFLNNYYQYMQKNTASRTGREIAAHIDDEDLATYVRNLCYKTNMSAIIIGEGGMQLTASDMLGMGGFFSGKKSMSTEDLTDAIAPVLSGEQTETISIVQNQTSEDMIIYVRAAQNEAGERFIILLNARLKPVSSTRDILKSQMWIITVVLIVLSLLISQFLSHQLVKPIKSITDKAKRLADGDYTADYDGDGIQELDELAESLNFSANGLSRVEELRRELVANVSHDLKTPLTMIRAYAEMIRDLTGDNKEKRDAQLEVIIDETNRLSDLVNDLIRVSRDEMLDREMTPETLDIRTMIEDVISRFAETCTDYEITCDCCDNNEVVADRTAIAQVLYNLISNAINYTGEDKKVMVTTRPCPNGLRVEVRDTGHGIPEDQIPLIWERYYRSRNTHRRPVAGSGLGLSIVRAALEKQNIPFGVESTVGEGSTFWFECPLSHE